MSDDEDDDDDDREPRTQNRGRNKPKGGNRGGGIDLASDPSFAWRFIRTTIGAFANDVGKMGYEIPAVHDALNAIESVLGPMMTSTGLNALAALLQNPKFVKEWIRARGLPEQINSLADDFIDDVVEGLRMALRGDHLNPDGANKALQVASQRLATKAGVLKVKTFEDAFMLLLPAEQAHMDLVLWVLSKPANAEQRKQFDLYRSKLASVVAQKTLLRCVAKGTPPFNPVDVVAYLQRTYGEIKPAGSAITGALGKITGGIKAADAALRRHVAPPATGPDPVEESLKAMTANLLKRRSQ